MTKTILDFVQNHAAGKNRIPEAIDLLFQMRNRRQICQEDDACLTKKVEESIKSGFDIKGIYNEAVKKEEKDFIQNIHRKINTIDAEHGDI